MEKWMRKIEGFFCRKVVSGRWSEAAEIKKYINIGHNTLSLSLTVTSDDAAAALFLPDQNLATTVSSTRTK